MKLKLDLHPFFSDGAKIESALESVIEEALVKRADEVEIIPGKGTGALKKTVLRFLDRPEIKAKYHRLDKDSDNWGRLFIYFRHERGLSVGNQPKSISVPKKIVACVCCGADFPVSLSNLPYEGVIACPSCGSPNRVKLFESRNGAIHAAVDWGYE
jgi:DNA-directed RNA polymerase subunit RPC12/RpoP